MRRAAQTLAAQTLAALAFAVFVTVFGGGVARAHGPAPAVLEVLRADEDGRPTLLRTSVGLAEAREDGTYGYLCPSLWSGNELARAYALRDGTVLVLDAGALYVSDPARETFARDEALEAGFAVRDVATDGERVFVLARERTAEGLGRSAIFELGERPRFVASASDPTPPGDLAVLDDGPLAASPTPSVCSLGGCLPLDAAPVDRLSVRGADRRAFWLVATTEVRTVWRVDRMNLVVTPGPAGELVLGPVRLGEHATVVVDGSAYVYDASGWSLLGGGHAWSSLDEVDGHVFASSLDGVVRLASRLEVVEAVFSFAQLDGPRESHEARCASDWAHFGGEAGWVGTRAARRPEGSRRPLGGGGCVAAGSPRGAGLVLGLVLGLVSGLASGFGRGPRRPRGRGDA